MIYSCLVILFFICGILNLGCVFRRDLFTQLGYGLCLSGAGITICVMGLLQWYPADIPHFLMLSLLVLFGNRSIRAYLMAQAMDRSNQIPLSLAVRQLFDQRSDQVIKGLGFWLIHTVEILLYLFPLLVRFFSGGAAVSSWIAMFTMLVGYSILNYQDHHGSAKLSNIGSLIFWLGVFLSAIEAIHGILQWGIFISAFIIRIWTLRKIFIQQ